MSNKIKTFYFQPITLNFSIIKVTVDHGSLLTWHSFSLINWLNFVANQCFFSKKELADGPNIIEKFILFSFFYDRPECMDHAATLFCATLILTKATADAHSNKISLRRDYRVSGKLNLCISLYTLNIDFLLYI